jgi:3-phenylpropionate/trans-cinnamate dioxygenase ferredoxin reductase subunit
MSTRHQVSASRTHVVVGAGLAGLKAAQELRALGFDGRVVLLGAEPEPPYDHPPLSKGYLRGESGREAVLLADPAALAAQDIDFRPGVAATDLDPPASRVALSDGSILRYDRLLLATGARPLRPALPGAELEGVHVLRTLADADRLRAALADAERVVVVGGGWIAAEVAASARQLGRHVTLAVRGPAPLASLLGEEVGEAYAALHRRHGVELLAHTRVERFEGATRVQSVRTGDERRLPADVVVFAGGALPDTALAQVAGLPVHRGVLVDDRLRSAALNVLAAGDVANAPTPFFGLRIRNEHWDNAFAQGKAAARAMLGERAPYDHLPYLFSDQYDTGTEYWGFSYDVRPVFRGDPGDRHGFVAFWLREDRVVAGLHLHVHDGEHDHDHDHVQPPIERLIRSQAPVDASRLTDPAVPFDELLGAAA